MGFLLEESSPVAWRGLMVQKALLQLLFDVDWGNLDVLVLDFPPGTSDTQLTICQELDLDGAVIVTSPQQLALDDVQRGIELFHKMKVPILGIVQNMGTFICPNCTEKHEIFGNSDALKRLADEYELDILADIPLAHQICKDADSGKPTVVADTKGPLAELYRNLASNIMSRIQ